MQSQDLPYKVEYENSSKSYCQQCRRIIRENVLRVATMVQVKTTSLKSIVYFHFHFSLFIMMPNILTGITSIASFFETIHDQSTTLPILRIFATKIKKLFVKKLNCFLVPCFPKQSQAIKERLAQYHL